MTEPRTQTRDDALEALSGALDDLGALDRASAPPGLAGRVYLATLPALRAPAEPPVYAFPRIEAPRRTMALAAALALLATVGSAWLAGRAPGGGQALAAAALDQWLASAEALDLALAESIDDVQSDAEALARAFGESWMPEDLIYPETTEAESM